MLQPRPIAEILEVRLRSSRPSTFSFFLLFAAIDPFPDARTAILRHGDARFAVRLFLHGFPSHAPLGAFTVCLLCRHTDCLIAAMLNSCCLKAMTLIRSGACYAAVVAIIIDKDEPRALERDIVSAPVVIIDIRHVPDFRLMSDSYLRFEADAAVSSLLFEAAAFSRLSLYFASPFRPGSRLR